MQWPPLTADRVDTIDILSRAVGNRAQSIYFLNNRSQIMTHYRIAIGALCLALFGLIAMPNSAQAQQQGAMEEDSLTYESLASALDDFEMQTQTLGQLDAQNVQVVNVEDIFSRLDDTQRQRLRRMYRNVETEALHTAIENSPTIMEALNNEAGTQVNASDVVAIDMQEEGQLVAYVDPNGTLEGRGTDDLEQQQEDDWQNRDTTQAEDVQQQDQDAFETEARQQDPQTFERIHSLMHDMKAQTQALTRSGEQQMENQPEEEQRMDAQNIRVVNVEDIMSDLDDEQIQRLRRTYQDAETDELHSALENNEDIMSALKTNAAAQVDASDVVAVDVQEEGETVVYVDPNGELKGRGMDDIQQREDEWQERDSTEMEERQQRGRDSTETQGFDQRETQERARDSSEASDVQEHAQPRDRNTQETGNVQQQAAQQQGAQTFERLHSLMHDMKTQTQALMQSGVQQMDEQSVRVINVEDITADLDDEQIQRLRRTYQNAETDQLHSALENNEAVMSALKTNTTTQVDASDVVAVEVQEGGETVVYVDPNGELEGDGTSDYE
jgi:site-specific DNA-adenine methylase